MVLAAILLAVVIATAARPQNPTTAASQVEVWMDPPAREVLLASRSNVTSRAKAPLQRASPFQGAVWGQNPAYDLTRTSQASIYVFYTPGSGD